MSKKTIVSIIIIALILIGGGFYWWQKHEVPVLEKPIEIIPQKGDIFGVEPDTKFIFKTNLSLSSNEIQEKLKITPAVSFEVKSTNNKGNFEILPKEDLATGKVYQVTFPLNDKNLSWAFEVKPLFKVISTTPRNESINIPLNAGIEIVFNRQGFKNPEQFFEITPQIRGHFEEKNETLIFVPAQNFEKGTVYQVKIKKGLQLKDSNDVLPEDFVFSFETTSEEKDIYFSFASDFIEVLPQKEPALRVSYKGINIENQNFNLYQFSTAEEFLESYNDSKSKFPWALSQSFNFNPDPNEKILSFQPKVIEEDKNIIIIPQSLKEGYYLLETEVNGEKTFCWLESSPISNYFAKTNENALIWTLDFQTNSPLENAKIKFFNQNEEFITDKNGLATFQTPEYLKNEDILNFLIIEKDGYLKKVTPILGKQPYYPWEKEDYYFDYFNTDRYLYRTDDTVHFWGAVKGRNESLIQKSLRVELVSSLSDSDEPILKQNVVVSNYGTISGDFSFKNLSPGFYTLNLYFGNDLVSSTYFETGIFSKPLYQIKVTPEKENIFLGENAIFKIKAEFFDGTPLSSEKLKYKTYFKGENEKGEIALDENGEGKIQVEPKYTASTAETNWPSSLDITVWPSLFEEGEIEGRAEINVFGPQMEVRTFNEYNGNKVKITAKLNEVDLSGDKENIGKPVADYPLDVEVKEITWQKVKTGQKYDYIEKTFYDIFEYQKEEKVIENLSQKTNKNGELILERELNPEKDYQFTFKGKDLEGNEFKKTDYINISLHNDLSGNLYSVFLKTNKEEEDYQIGEKIPLILEKGDATPFSTNEKFLFFGFQNKIEKTIFSDTPETNFNFEENYIPNIQFRGVWLSERGFVESNNLNFPFDVSQKTLQINISADKEKYRPGENVNLEVETKKDNSFKKSEAKIAVIDEALLALAPDYYNNNIFNFYDNVFTVPFTTFSRYLIPEMKTAESGGCFGAGTKILMEDGKEKNIEEIKPGDVILTKESEDSKSSLLPAIVQHLSSYFVQDYLLINNNLKITPEHKVFLNGKWQEAIKVRKGDFLLDKNGKNIEIQTIEIKHEPTKVYNIIVGDYHTFFANGIFVHNEEKGAETRENFPDLAFYQVLGLKDGSQNVNFKLPDNLTSWRIIVEAISDDADVGKAIKDISVSLPFFVNLTLNENYLLEDNFQVIAKAFGEKYKKGTPVSFTLSLPELNYEKTIQTTEGIVAFELPQVSKEGEYQIKLEGHWQNYSDAILRKIKFQKTPLQDTTLKLYSLSENLTQVEGNKEGITHLVFLDRIRGRVYPILKENLSSIGERVEKKIAPYFASQLLKEYFNEENNVEEIDLSPYITNEGISLVPWGGDDVLTSSLIANLSPDTFLKYASPSYFNEILESDERTNLDKSIALFGLSSLSEPVLSKINLFEKYNKLNLEEEIYLTLARVSLGDYETARELYLTEIRPNLTFRSDVFYLNLNDKDKEVKLTGILASLCAILDEEDQFGLSEYLFQNNPPSNLKILESLIYIKNFLSNYSSNFAASFDYKIGEKEGSVDLSQGRIFELNLLPEELSNLKFSNVKGDIQLQSWFQKPITKEELKKSDTISLSKTFLLNGKETIEFQQGDLVLVKLNPNFTEKAPDGLYTITDWLPAGLKPVVESFRDEQWEKSTECNLVGHPFSFEGNKVSFLWTKEFDKSENCPDKDISYYARVVIPGTYKAPVAILQSLKAAEVITSSDEYIVKIK